MASLRRLARSNPLSQAFRSNAGLRRKRRRSLYNQRKHLAINHNRLHGARLRHLPPLNLLSQAFSPNARLRRLCESYLRKHAFEFMGHTSRVDGLGPCDASLLSQAFRSNACLKGLSASRGAAPGPLPPSLLSQAFRSNAGLKGLSASRRPPLALCHPASLARRSD